MSTRAFSTELIGMEAWFDGRPVGIIDDIVADLSSGEIKFLLLTKAEGLSAKHKTALDGRRIVEIRGMDVVGGKAILSLLFP